MNLRELEEASYHLDEALVRVDRALIACKNPLDGGELAGHSLDLKRIGEQLTAFRRRAKAASEKAT